MRYSNMFLALIALGLVSINSVLASTNSEMETIDMRGPDQVVIQSTIDTEKVARPAYLPHRSHQWLECYGCHHIKGTGGKMAEYVAGQKVEKCETCHNSKVAAMPEMIATLKRASHRLCMECHLQQETDLARCGVCHTKK